MASLSASDYRCVLEFLHLAGEEHGPDPFPEGVLTELRRLVPCDVVSYGDYDADGRAWRCAPRWVGEPRAPLTEAIREATCAFRSQIPHTPRDDLPVLRWSDRYSRRALRRLDLYWEVNRPLGCEYELTVWLKHGSAVLGGFHFDRSRSDFSDRDVCFLETLLPHLVQLAHGATERWADVAALLTRREREILGWVARGRTNGEIAWLLCISQGTVRKHLDNIYDKLDVSNRTAAVGRAYGLS